MIDTLKLLKEKTMHLHKELEAVSYSNAIMSKTISSEEYEALLTKNFLIYKELEPKLNHIIADLKNKDLQQFSSERLPDLKKDLTSFSLSKKITPFEIASFEFPVDDIKVPTLIGWLYVLEGSRLGGKVIVKALRNNPSLESIAFFNFYQQENIDIRSRWMAFRNMVPTYINNEKEANQAVDAANQMFSFFYEVHRLDKQYQIQN